MSLKRKIRVYVAHPKVTYGSAWETTCLAAIATALPDAELMNPVDLFESNEHWRRKNLIVLGEADLIVVFGDEKGWIGMGTFSEIGAAAAMGKTVLYLDLFHLAEADQPTQQLLITGPVGGKRFDT